MNEIDVPRFKRGKGAIGDFVKKHKKKLALTAGAIAGLAALAGSLALAHKSSEAHRGYRPGFPERPFNPLQIAESEADVEQYKRDIETEIRALRHQARRESKLSPPETRIIEPPRTPTLPSRRLEQSERLERYNRFLDRDPPALIPATPILQPRRITSMHEEKQDTSKPSKGRGKPNPLAKKVMAYKKKHGCSLKEAWAQFK